MKKIIISTILITLFIGCKKKEKEDITTEADLGPLHEVNFQDYNGSYAVTPMSNGCHHEVWLQNASGENYSIGTYVQTANGSGELVFMVPESIILEAVKAFVTIESNNDTDPGPSKTIYSGGSFQPNVMGNLLYNQNENDFSPLGTGPICFIIEKVTSIDGGNSFGVWLTQGQGPWGCNTMPTPNGYLRALSAEQGYCYESWIEYNGQQISMGKFFNPNQADMSALYYLEGSGYNYPGEIFYHNLPSDFLNQAIQNHKFYLSIEPYPDYSPEPYFVWSGKQSIGLTGFYDIQLQVISNAISPSYSSTGQCEIHSFL